MVNPFVALDRLLLDGVAQRIADWVQIRWGKTCFWLQKQTVTLAFALYVLWAILDSIQRPLDVDTWSVIFAGFKLASVVLLLAIGPSLYRMIDAQEEQVLNSRQANPRRVRDVFVRLNMVFVAAVSDIVYLAGPDPFRLDNYAFAGYMTTLAAVGYFAACTPRPPAPAVRSAVPSLRTAA